MRIKIFPEEGTELILTNICEKFGAKFIIGGTTEHDARMPQFNTPVTIDRYVRWYVAYIECNKDSQAMEILNHYLDSKTKGDHVG